LRALRLRAHHRVADLHRLSAGHAFHSTAFRPDFDWKLTALAGGTLRYAASALLAVPGLHQASNANFGSIKPTKGFRLLETEAGHAEVTPRGLHLVQHKVDCLCNNVLFSWFWMDFAHSAAGLR
jgi:hypothetical protein